MTARDFAYWLQGYFEISCTTELSMHQTAIIRNHLNMVFKHEIDPSHGDAAHQKKLSDAHQGVDIMGRVGILDSSKIRADINC